MSVKRTWKLAGAVFFAASMVMGAVQAETVIRIDEVAVGELDPGKASDYADSILMWNIYDTLVMAKQGGGGVVPMLAKSWGVEGTTFRFDLRDDVKFHSGNPMTAEDVVFSYERMVGLGQGFAFLFKGWVETVEAVDDHTVQFTLSATYAPFISALVRLPIIDKKAILANLQDGDFGDLKDYGQAFLSEHDAGTGAYMIESHNPLELTVMAKNPNYFLGVPNKAPDKARMRYGLEPATARTMVIRGELDIASNWLPPEVKKSLEARDGVHLVKEGGVGGFYIKLNTQKAPLDDVHCRRALALAFDYDAGMSQVAITDKVSGGVPARGPLPGGMLGYSMSIPVAVQDIAAAKKELGLCKYTAGDHELEISWVAEVPLEERFALLMQQNFSELGFKTKIVGVPWALFTERVSKVESTPHISQVFVTATAPDPDSLIYGMYHSSASGTWRSPEWVNDPEVDRLLDSGRATIDQAERQSIYEELVARLIEIQPTIYAYEMVSVFPANESINIPGLMDPAMQQPVMAANFTFRFMEMN